MVIYTVKWDIRPEKAEAYPEWAQSAMTNMSLELWGPSPIVPEPIRPRQ